MGILADSSQNDFFRPLLVDFINPNQGLVLLADKIDWKSIEDEFNGLYSQVGQRGVPDNLRSLQLGKLQYLTYLFMEALQINQGGMVDVHPRGFDALALGTQSHTGLTVFYEKFYECFQSLFGDGTSVLGFTEGALWTVHL